MVVFGITCRCVSEINRQDVIRCVDSILEFHPKSKIIVVDSSSPDKTYFNILKKRGVIIEDISNSFYETGTWWHVYKNFKAETYIFLQDSMFLKKPIDEFFTDPFRAIHYMEGWKNITPKEKKWAEEVFQEVEYSFIENNEFKMIQFNSFIISSSILSILVKKKFDTILPQEKYQSQAMERLLGIALTQEGYTNLSPIGENYINKTWRKRK